MTATPDEFIDPGQAFLDSLNPENVLDDPLGTVSEVEVASTRALTAATVALSLAAAFMVMRVVISARLAAQTVPDGTPYNVATDLWRKLAPLWLRMSVPAITHAFELGAIDLASMTHSEVQAMAVEYAQSLGEHINDSSAEALSQGFNAQLAGGWNERLAWQRASTAYGLDKEQMRSFASSKVGMSNYAGDPLDDATRLGVDKALLMRADRLGGNETHAAIQMGKTISWMAAAARDEIDPNSDKVWRTAADELVCPICGPMDGQVAKLYRQFETPQGSKLWGPGVHPNCRCTVELNYLYPESGYVEKALGRDRYDRNRLGRFSEHEERTSRVAERPVEEEQLERMEEDLQRTTDPFAVAKPDPFSLTRPDPFSLARPDPFSLAKPDPFSLAKPDPFALAKPETVDPFALAKTDPFSFAVKADPFSLPAPGKRRVTLFYKGQKQVYDIPPAVEFSGPPSIHQYVAETRTYKARMYPDEINPTFQVGAKIDFDRWAEKKQRHDLREYGEESSELEPYRALVLSAGGVGIQDLLSEEAGHLNEEAGDMESTQRNFLRQAAIKRQHDHATDQVQDAVRNQMNDLDVDRIYTRAGMPPAQLHEWTEEQRRDRLIEDVQSGAASRLRSSYLQWVEDRGLYADRGGPQDEEWEPVLEIFSFPEGGLGNFHDVGGGRLEIMARGRYRVKNIYDESASDAFGNAAPQIMGGITRWRMIELERVGE